MKKIAVDIFSGAGGLSVGAKMAGIESLLAVEYCKHAASTYQKNHQKTKVLNKDIKSVNPLDYTEKNPFILFGGPPCQGFSIANTKTRNLDNPNNWMFKEYIRFVEDLEPEWFLFENVVGFKSFNNGEFAKEVETNLKNLGYTTSSGVLCASDFGVPQKRKRFFIIGNRFKKKFDFNSLKKESVVSVKDAISDLPSLKNGEQLLSGDYKPNITNSYLEIMRKKSDKPLQNIVSKNKEYIIERYKYIRQGKNWQDIPKKLLSNYSSTVNMHSGIYKRLDENQPTVTIANYRKSMLIHPTEDRGLSLREAARLQSFPDDFIFEGPLSYQQQQVGNAVPPLLAKVIFENILFLDNQ
ncbi:DNA cytosine methyltransferase [Arcobacter sp. 15-2]|uniref:DNA cytosine methyltransferase n=1 Tax=Arcobacter sp. 15-2 TaxID=3374109 RepID=UPI00399D2B35